jgi:hypothetical protein
MSQPRHFLINSDARNLIWDMKNLIQQMYCQTLQSDMEGSDIKLIPISFITVIGLSARLYDE